MFELFGTPKEVKDTCYEIESGVFDNIAASAIKNAAIDLARDKEKTIYSIKEEGVSPAILAHILITNSIQELLLSGQYHVYRGILNAVGNAMVDCWDNSVDQLEILGRYSPQEAEDDKNWIRNEIKLIGRNWQQLQTQLLFLWE